MSVPQYDPRFAVTLMPEARQLYEGARSRVSIAELSVARNVYLGREPVGRFGLVDRDRLYRDTQAILDLYHLRLDADAPVAGLSVAQRKLVEVARALSLCARVLILDEPTAVLSLVEQDNLFAIIAGLRRSGLLVLYVSHRLEELFGIADRISVLRDGHLVETVEASGVTQRELVRLMTGHDVQWVTASRSAPANEAPVLRLTSGDAGAVAEGVGEDARCAGCAAARSTSSA